MMNTNTRARQQGTRGPDGEEEPGTANPDPKISNFAASNFVESSQTATTSANNDDDNNNANVPKLDWSWGTIWVKDEIEEADASELSPTPTAKKSNEKGAFAHAETYEYNAEDIPWMSDFVEGLTPTPRIPISTTPRPTPKPTSRPTLTPTITNNACQLCSDGSTATKMSQTLIGTTISCQDLADSFLAASSSQQDCVATKESIPINIEAYCGCPGVTMTTPECLFCSDGTVNIWHNVTIPALNDWTCQDVEDYTGFITNTDACSEMTAISDLCCGTWEEYWGAGNDDDDDRRQ